MELVWDRAGRHYHWHVILQDGTEPTPAPGSAVIAVDLGEIHPATLTDGHEAVVITARCLRATHQYTAKRLAEIQAKQAGKKKVSAAGSGCNGARVAFLLSRRSVPAIVSIR